MMNKRERIESVIIYGVLFFYILFLIKLLLLSRVSLSDLFNGQRSLSRQINLVPFQSIMEYISGASVNLRKFAFSNVVGNIVIFIPLGVYLSLIKKDRRVLSILWFIFLVSLLVEVVQGLLGIGTADIDDIILNCLGGLIGILVYRFLLFILRNEKNARTAITILSVAGLPVLLYLLFIIRLRL